MRHFAEPSWLAEPRVRDLMAKVRYFQAEGWEKGVEAPQEVVVRMTDGREYSKLVAVHATKGDPNNPMTEAETAAKYRDCACVVLSPSDIERSLEMIDNLELLEDISKLMEIVTKTKARARRRR